VRKHKIIYTDSCRGRIIFNMMILLNMCTVVSRNELHF